MVFGGLPFFGFIKHWKLIFIWCSLIDEWYRRIIWKGWKVKAGFWEELSVKNLVGSWWGLVECLGMEIGWS